MIRLAAFATGLIVLAGAAGAHESSLAYLTLRIDGAVVEGRLDIALRDLEDAVGLDVDGDRSITWGEFQERKGAVLDYAASRLRFGERAECSLQFSGNAIDTHGAASFAVLTFSGRCAAPPPESVDYALLFDVDPTHRALIEITNRDGYTTAVLDDANRVMALRQTAESAWRRFGRFVAEGIGHIWQGLDHLVFLGLLLVPAVKRRSDTPARVAWYVARVVTAFTVAHSLTLSLAALEVVSLPAQLVEAVIAASIVVAGVASLLPNAAAMSAGIAFGFGLVHGFGFANALQGLGRGPQLVSLAGFNLGVEIGQLVVAIALLPLLLLLNRAGSWRQPVLASASMTVSGIGVVWLLERLA